MLDVVVGVVRSTDGRSVTLKHKKGKESVLKRTMEYLVLEGRALTIWDGFGFENEARSPEGQLLGDEYEAIEKSDRPVFTPVSSKSNSGITADVTTGPRLYWFKEGTVGEVTRRSLTIRRGERSDRRLATAIVHPDLEGGTGEFSLSLVLPDQQFERLLRTVWSARPPCRLRVDVHIVCFGESPLTILLAADKSIPTKLDEIYANQSTLGPLPVVSDKQDDRLIEAQVEQNDPMLAAIRRLQSTMLSIKKALWWSLAFVVVIAIIAFLRR